MPLLSLLIASSLAGCVGEPEDPGAEPEQAELDEAAALAAPFLSVGFESWSLGTYTAARVRADWGTSPFDGVAQGRVEVAADPTGAAGKAIRVKYPRGGVGPAAGGAQWRASVPARNEMYASYRVYFPAGFNPVKGGKLPGLCGGPDCPTGGVVPTGKNGFSARFMFRPNNRITLYLYHMDQPDQYGQDFQLAHTFAYGQWHRITQRVKLNTPGQANGEVQVWVGTKQVLLLGNLRFRTETAVKIDRFYFSTFFGGNTPDWAPVKDEAVFFDQLKVADTAAGVGL